jgi:heme exporter protein B
VSLVRHAARVAWKDLMVEVRTKEIIYTMAFFAGLLVVVFAIAFPPNPRLVAGAAPGMLWVTLAFAGVIGLGRAFDRERENDTMRALLLAPVPRLAVFLGKAAAMTVLVLVVAAVALPLLALFVGADVFRHPGPMLVSVVLGAVGFALVGTVFAASLLKVRSRDVLLPVVLFPLLIPLFISGTNAAAAMLRLPEGDPAAAWYWIRFLGIYDAVFLVVSLWTFESLVIE